MWREEHVAHPKQLAVPYVPGTIEDLYKPGSDPLPWFDKSGG